MSDAAWHPDPTERFHHRYYDGSRWTEHVADVAGTQLVDPHGAPGETMAAGGEAGAGWPPAGGDDRPAGSGGPPPWGGQSGGAGGSWGAAPPARKKVDKVSVVGLVLAVVGIVVGLLSLFALPWLEVGGQDIDFSDARQGVDDTGVFGAVAGGLMINVAYFIVLVGGTVAVAKALGSRRVGIVGLALAVVALIALIAIGVAAIPVDDSPSGLPTGDTASGLQSEGEDRLAATAAFTGVVMFISTVLVGVGLMLHGIAGRILSFLGLALVALFALGGIFVLRGNYEDLALGLASVDLSLGSWAIVAAALLLAVGSAVPGGRKEA